MELPGHLLSAEDRILRTATKRIPTASAIWGVTPIPDRFPPGGSFISPCPEYALNEQVLSKRFFTVWSSLLTRLDTQAIPDYSQVMANDLIQTGVDISVEEAIKIIISGGVLKSEEQRQTI